MRAEIDTSSAYVRYHADAAGDSSLGGGDGLISTMHCYWA